MCLYSEPRIRFLRTSQVHKHDDSLGRGRRMSSMPRVTRRACAIVSVPLPVWLPPMPESRRSRNNVPDESNPRDMQHCRHVIANSRTAHASGLADDWVGARYLSWTSRCRSPGTDPGSCQRPVGRWFSVEPRAPLSFATVSTGRRTSIKPGAKNKRKRYGGRARLLEDVLTRRREPFVEALWTALTADRTRLFAKRFVEGAQNDEQNNTLPSGCRIKSETMYYIHPQPSAFRCVGNISSPLLRARRRSASYCLRDYFQCSFNRNRKFPETFAINNLSVSCCTVWAGRPSGRKMVEVSNFPFPCTQLLESIRSSHLTSFSNCTFAAQHETAIRKMQSDFCCACAMIFMYN